MAGFFLIANILVVTSGMRTPADSTGELQVSSPTAVPNHSGTGVDINTPAWKEENCGLSSSSAVGSVFLLACGVNAAPVKARLEQRIMDFRTSNKLTEKLKIMVIEDGCLLKKTFWGRAAPNLEGNNNPYGLSHRWLNYSVYAQNTYAWATQNEAALAAYADGIDESAFGALQHWDPGWCVDWRSDWGLPVQMPEILGEAKATFTSVSMFLELAPDGTPHAANKGAKPESAEVFDLKGAVLQPKADMGKRRLTDEELQPDQRKQALFLEELANTDMVILNGGNPDFMSFALRTVGARVLAAMRDKLASGQLFWLSQGAGSMVTAADIGLSYESHPFILQNLMPVYETKGLEMVGQCAIRPHFHEWEFWHFVIPPYATLKNLNVLGMTDDSALECQGARCFVYMAPELVRDQKYHRRMALAFGHLD